MTWWYLKFRKCFSVISENSRRINMKKRKRKSKQQQSFIFFSSFSSKFTTMQDILISQSKKHDITFSFQTSISAIQSQAISQMNTCSLQINKKLWNWFYKSLILLLTYEKSQRMHVKFDETSFKEYLDDSNKTLSKRFLNELAYICNYSLDEDTVTTIAIQNESHLIYWMIINTSKESKIKSFLFNILQLLDQMYNTSEKWVSTLEYQISDCTMIFSAQKLQRYRFMLKRMINICLSILKRQNEEDRINFTDLRASLCIIDSLIKH